MQEKNILDDLYKTILNLDNINECRTFLSDLCTPEELRSMSERWRVAQLIYEEIPYRNIYNATGVSTATITRVARCLKENPNSGYLKLIKKKKDISNG